MLLEGKTAPSWWGCLCPCVQLAKSLLSRSFLFTPEWTSVFSCFKANLWHDGSTSRINLSHHGACKSNRNFQIIEEMKFASHVIFQIHLKCWQRKPTPPRVFSYSARPLTLTWLPYISRAIVKEWYNARVGLHGNKESTIEHLCKPGRRDITVDATILISLCFRNQGRLRNRSP